MGRIFLIGAVALWAAQAGAQSLPNRATPAHRPTPMPQALAARPASTPSFTPHVGTPAISAVHSGAGYSGYHPGAATAPLSPRMGVPRTPALAHLAQPAGARPAGPGSHYFPSVHPQFSDRHFSYHGRVMAAVHAQPYRFVRGYNYRVFGIGARFPAFLLLSDYFLADYYIYNLAPPGPGLTWVRFGPDALLVNTWSGQVVDTAPGLFDDSAPSPEGDGPPPGYADPGGQGGDPPYPGPNGYPAPIDRTN